jgi:hypothetical protein
MRDPCGEEKGSVDREMSRVVGWVGSGRGGGGIDESSGVQGTVHRGVHLLRGACPRRGRYPSAIHTCTLDVPSRYPPYSLPNGAAWDAAVNVMRLQGEKKAR